VVKKLEYIVTGTGRCGTVFLARFLTSIGIPCGHEFVFGPFTDDVPTKLKRENSKLSSVSKKNCSDWVDEKIIVADSSFLSAPYLDHPALKRCKIIHLVRDPILVISSFILDGQYFINHHPKDIWEDFIYYHLPEFKRKMSAVERAARYYVEWNEMIKEKSKGLETLFFRIEKDDLSKILAFVKKDVSLLTSAFSDKSCNTWRKRSIDIAYKEIPEPAREPLLAMASDFGYVS
jgi:hypothetical protein